MLGLSEIHLQFRLAQQEIMRGEPFFAVLKKYRGLQAALARRLKTTQANLDHWARRGTVPTKRVEAIALALNITPSRIPVAKSRLQRAGEDIRNGCAFFVAIDRNSAGLALTRAVNRTANAYWNWRKCGGCPRVLVNKIAAALNCRPSAVAVSAGNRGYPRVASDSERASRREIAIRIYAERPELRQQISRRVKDQPRDYHGNFVARAKPKPRPNYRDPLDRATGAYGFPSKSSLS